MRKIGFSHGVLHKIIDPYTPDNINILRESGSNAVEINCHHTHEAERLDALLPFIKGCEYISLHTPGDTRYANNSETRTLLEKLVQFYKASGATLAVVHPDLVDDWEVFNNFDINWATENMDDRKKNFKEPSSFTTFFQSHPQWGLVLDVGHCNVNDKTMKLAYDFITEFKDRIQEIHLSGYEVYHDPLYRSQQTEIIESCKELDVPIIIESVLEESDGIEGIKKEFDYIKQNLK